MLSKLKGYRSYLAAAGLVVAAVTAAVDGDYTRAWEALCGALAVFGLRSALPQGTEAPTPPPPAAPPAVPAGGTNAPG